MTPVVQPPVTHSRQQVLLGRLLRAVVLGTVLAVLAVAGGCWYFASAAVTVDHTPFRPHTVERAGSGTVRLTKDAYSVLPGRYGLLWDVGYGTVGPVIRSDGDTVERTYTPVRGTPPVGTRAWVDPYAYSGDPRSALGLDVREVSVRSDVGDLPTWFVPAAVGATTWVVFVHGYGATREESLRYLPDWHARGLPVLVPMYRNDVGAPAAAGGRSRLGDTEWRDVESAVRWAQEHGATAVVLAGWSLGGAIAMQLLARSDVAPAVVGVILDSPVLDWRATFRRQAAARGLPGWFSALAVQTLALRTGIDFDAFDWPARAGELDVPVLIFHSGSDSYVPVGPSRAVAAARPDLVTFVDVPGAEHTRSWNVDPLRHAQVMSGWFTAYGIGPDRPG